MVNLLNYDDGFLDTQNSECDKHLEYHRESENDEDCDCQITNVIKTEPLSIHISDDDDNDIDVTSNLQSNQCQNINYCEDEDKGPLFYDVITEICF